MSIRAWLVAGALASSGAVAAVEPPSAPIAATLSVSDEVAGPRIEPAVYGQFVEHLGAGVEGGLWVGTGSPIANTRGFRDDVIGALRRLHVPVVRWPGGCFADDYDWRDGIGPPDRRPVRLNKVWGGVPEDNRVGTHEFMDFAGMIGADVYIAGNMGSMTPRAMAQWLEYMTSADTRSSLANERRRNGRDAPWQVKYLGIGNESWGCGGHMRPEYAADLHRQYATFLRTPVVRVASGDGQGDDHVTEVMMDRARDDMDALSLHYYTVPGEWAHKGRATGFDAARWARTLQVALRIDDRIAATSALQAMILTDGDRMLLTPTYSVFDLYQPFQGATPLKTTLLTPRYDQDGAALPAVDVSAARGLRGATLLALVNLDPRRAARVSTNLAGAAAGRLLTASAMDAHNTFEHPDAVAPVPFAGVMVDGRRVFDLPAKSIAVVSVIPEDRR